MATHLASTHSIEHRPFASELPTHGEALRYLAPVGRALFACIFLMAAPGHFTQATIGHAASQGVPMASVAVPLSGVLALAGGLSILLGYKTRLGAALLILFLVPVTLMMHDFWSVVDPV